MQRCFKTFGSHPRNQHRGNLHKITERMIDAHGPGRGIIQQNADRGLKRFSMICCRRNSDSHQSFQKTAENKPS